MSCSDWCRTKYEAAVERGDDVSARHYMDMYQLWLDRETATQKASHLHRTN